MFPTTIQKFVGQVHGPLCCSQKAPFKPIRTLSTKIMSMNFSQVLHVGHSAMREVINDFHSCIKPDALGDHQDLLIGLKDAREGFHLVRLLRHTSRSRSRSERALSLPMAGLSASPASGVCDAIRQTSAANPKVLIALRAKASTTHRRLALFALSTAFGPSQWPKTTALGLVSQALPGFLIACKTRCQVLTFLAGSQNLLFELLDEHRILVATFQQLLHQDVFIHLFLFMVVDRFFIYLVHIIRLCAALILALCLQVLEELRSQQTNALASQIIGKVS